MTTWRLYRYILGSSTSGKPVQGQHETRSVGPTQLDINVHSNRGRHARAPTTSAIGRQRRQEWLLAIGRLRRLASNWLLWEEWRTSSAPARWVVAVCPCARQIGSRNRLDNNFGLDNIRNFSTIFFIPLGQNDVIWLNKRHQSGNS